MTSKLDLNLVSLYRQGGQDQPALPGLLAAVPPRRTARGREGDRLLICLSITGNVRLTAAEYAEITRQMADRYYGLTGAVTSALKNTAESLNAFLLERNMRMSGRGQVATGLLVMGALRDNQLYLVLSGPVHAFWMSPRGSRHFFDDQLAGRGLGTSQTTRLYYAQVELESADRVFFATQLPAGWAPVLEAERGAATLEALRRRLMAEAGPEAQGVLITAQEGAGQINILRAAPPAAEAKPVAAPAPAPAPEQSVPQPAPASQAEPTPQQPAPQPARPPMQRPPVAAPAATQTPEPQSVASSTPPQRPPIQRPPVATSEQPAVSPKTEKPAQPAARGLPFKLPALRPASASESSPEPKILVRQPAPDRFQPFFKQLAAGIRSARQSQQRFGEGLKRFMPRLLPGQQEEDGMQQSAGRSVFSMFMALALPVIIITMGVVVYIQYGRTAQYESYYASAVQAAESAAGIGDQIALRRTWEETLFWLDKAEDYQNTPESRNLRRQAQAQLDLLDRINRVNFQLALPTPFLETIKVNRMVASETDVFLLNAERGEIYRVMLTQRGYELDSNFICRPGTYGSGVVGPLVDLVSLPRTNLFGAVAAGIDASGTLLYCLPNGQSPQPVPLPTPDVGWKRIAAIGLDQGSLYVLDSDANAVWTYYGNQSSFAEAPFFFFDEQIPPMGNVVDMAVNGDDIYLLNSDGHLITCTLSRYNASPTRCVDPAFLNDTRAGRQGGTTLPDAIFSQVIFSPPPDISVALLDAKNRAVYRFSPRGLELQDQLRPVIGEDATLPPGTITAMAFSPNQIFFVFVDGRLYYATDVP